MTKDEFFSKAMPAAKASGHIFPEYAVCEAALESAWGQSKLAQVGNNLFGQKQGFSAGAYPTIQIPTREFLNGQYETVPATWPVFPDWETAFRERMQLLNLSKYYALAVTASTGDAFIRAVSQHWSTDPKRADKVLDTYRCNEPMIQQLLQSS